MCRRDFELRMSGRPPVPGGATVLLALLLALLFPSGTKTQVPAWAPGEVVAWGDDTDCKLCVPQDTGYVAIAAGAYHSLARRADGSLYAWGADAYGQVRDTPTDAGYLDMDGGTFHSVALTAEKTIRSWGRDYERQVSDTPTDSGYKQVSAGGFHSVALKEDGTIVAWGYNDRGQCDVPTDGGYIAISAGAYHNLALKEDGTIVVWGWDYYGQVSLGPTGPGFKEISAGDAHSLALTADGTIVAWGADWWGVLDVPAGNGYVAISAGYRHNLALTSDRRIIAWGYDIYDLVTGAPEGAGWTDVSTGYFHNVALWPPAVPAPEWPDLRVEALSDPPAKVSPGRQFAVTDTTANRGGLEAASSRTCYYLSTDLAPGLADIQLACRQVPALPPEGTSLATTKVKVPKSLAAGRYYLLAYADATSIVAESDEMNNVLKAAKTVDVVLPKR